jgi:DNA-directed RNA polymerase subunit RPC12/RpoP
MKWRNLLYNKCPKCEKGDLDFDGRLIKCEDCDFKISELKMADMIAKQQEEQGEYNHDKEMILCDVCGREFEGEVWMLQSHKEITCPDCYRDCKKFL